MTLGNAIKAAKLFVDSHCERTGTEAPKDFYKSACLIRDCFMFMKRCHSGRECLSIGAMIMTYRWTTSMRHSMRRSMWMNMMRWICRLFFKGGT